MRVGLSERFNIMQQSPLDLAALPAGETLKQPGKARWWLPSRYTFRARTTDGRLVLWNSNSGAIAVFQSDQAPVIESLLTQKGFEAEEEGIVKYLVDHGFLARKGTDEYAVFQFAFGQAQHRSDILDLTLLASEDCNFRCIYCYEKFTRGTMSSWVRRGIKEYVTSRLPGLRVLTIGWFGGEPLYGFAAIEDLAPFFLQVAQEKSLVFNSHMTTNGYLLTPEIAEQLLSWRINQFQITLDGPPTCHDHSRPSREGGKTFDIILTNLRAMAGHPEKFRIDLRVNFSPQNAPGIGEFLDLIEREFGQDSRFRIRFRPVGKWGGSQDGALEVCGLGEADQLIREFERLAREKGLMLADAFKSTSSFGAQVCYAARPYHLIVGASGKLMKCTVALDRDERNVVGNMTPDGRAEIDPAKLAPWVAPAFEKDTQCQRCVVLPVCQGCSCPLPRITHGERSCIPARSNWKKVLLSLVESTPSSQLRTVGPTSPA
jgi:uncharacterized protein